MGNIQAAIIYVNSNATGNNNGTSWINAFSNLQNALSVSMPGDEIWVASGIYKPSETNNRASQFVMKNGVNLYGGFSGIETNINQRDIEANPTTLSGDIGEIGSNNDNSRTLVRIVNIATDLIFDGFRVVSSYDEVGSAGGFYIFTNTGNISIKNCIIFNNYAYSSGGGVFIKSSNVTFADTEFLYNSSFDYGGGAIYASNASLANITIQNCKFIGNTSRSGGVIKFDGNNLLINKTLITNNSNTSGSGLIEIGGTSNCLFTISNSLVIGNVLTNSGGSIISSYTSGSNSSKIINVTICHNRNSSSIVNRPILYKVNGAMNISNSIVHSNTSPQIYTGNSIVNSIIQNGYTSGTNILNVDPMFVNSSSLASAPFDASSFDYSLQSISEGINAGNNTYVSAYTEDYLGNSRIQESIVDIGAIESSYNLSTISFDYDSSYFFDNSTKLLKVNNLEEFRNSEGNIYDLNGRLILKIKITEKETYIDLNQGIYILRLDNKSSMKILITE